MSQFLTSRGFIVCGRSAMYIQQNSYNVNMCGKKDNPRFWNRLKQTVLDVFPSATIKDGTRRVDKWKKSDELLSNPAVNRLIMGATALVTQPSIDYYNHKVDKETREVSRIRTISKILAGTAVGIAVRGACFILIEEMTNFKDTKRLGKALLPPKFLSELASDAKLLKNYRNALSTTIAVLAMSVTNFLIDAPLTVFLTNHFNDKRLKKKEEAERRIQ